MNEPEKILVNKERLTLEDCFCIISVKHSHWKYDVLTDIYTTIQIISVLFMTNSKKHLMDVYPKFIERQRHCRNDPR